MARALVLSDLHDNLEAFKAIIKNIVDYDLLILSGDICEFKCSEFAVWFKMLKVPIIIVHGNHDCVPCFEVLSNKVDTVYFLRNNVMKLRINNEELVIGGLGGVFSEKKSDMHHFNPDDILKIANKMLREDTKLDILITHECARNCSDIIPHTRKRGGKTELYILHIIGRPRIHICGHMHTPWIERRDGILCVNPGYGFIGLGAILDLDKLRAEIFQVKLKINLLDEHKVIYTYNWIRNVKRSYFRILRNESIKLRSSL